MSRITELYGQKFAVIDTYSRAEAIADGVLIDVTPIANEAGIRLPTAITPGVQAECVSVPAGLEGCGQSTAGRLWDVVYMAKMFAMPVLVKACIKSGDAEETTYQLHILQKPPTEDDHDSDTGGTTLVTLKAHLGPGDDGKPVVTIMLRHED